MKDITMMECMQWHLQPTLGCPRCFEALCDVATVAEQRSCAPAEEGNAMSEDEKRLRAILPAADEATLDAALAAAEARGFARARSLAERSCAETEAVFADCTAPEQVAVRETAKAIRERIRAMRDEGGGA